MKTRIIQRNQQPWNRRVFLSIPASIANKVVVCSGISCDVTIKNSTLHGIRHCCKLCINGFIDWLLIFRGLFLVDFIRERPRDCGRCTSLIKGIIFRSRAMANRFVRQQALPPTVQLYTFLLVKILFLRPFQLLA